MLRVSLEWHMGSLICLVSLGDNEALTCCSTLFESQNRACIILWTLTKMHTFSPSFDVFFPSFSPLFISSWSPWSPPPPHFPAFPAWDPRGLETIHWPAHIHGREVQGDCRSQCLVIVLSYQPNAVKVTCGFHNVVNCICEGAVLPQPGREWDAQRPLWISWGQPHRTAGGETPSPRAADQPRCQVSKRKEGGRWLIYERMWDCAVMILKWALSSGLSLTSSCEPNRSSWRLTVPLISSECFPPATVNSCLIIH